MGSNGKQSYESLLEVLEGLDPKARYAIELQESPDPDALGSGMAIAYVAKQLFGLQLDITHGGEIGFPNIIMVDKLGLEDKLRPYDEEGLEASTYKGFIFADHYGPTSNWYMQGRRDRKDEEQVLADDQVLILIDHHDVGNIEPSYKAMFADRRDVGSTCSIITDYFRSGLLERLGIESPEKDAEFLKVAHGLMYGIRSDTNQLATAKDFDHECFQYLAQFGSTEFVINELEHPDVPKEWENLKIKAYTSIDELGNGSRMTNVGFTKQKNKAALGMIADELLRVQGITTTYVWGFLPKTLSISIRTRDPLFKARVKELKAGLAGATGGGRRGVYALHLPNFFHKHEFGNDMTPEEEELAIKLADLRLKRKLV